MKKRQPQQLELLEPTLPMDLPSFVPSPLGPPGLPKVLPPQQPFTFSPKDPAARAVRAVKPAEEETPIMLVVFGHA